MLQFGLGIVVAIQIFLIRQDGELDEAPYTTAEYVITSIVFGFVPFALSMAVIAWYRRRAGWTWADLGVTRRPHGWFERRLWWRSSIVYGAALFASSILMVLLSELRGSGGYPDESGAEVARVLSIVPVSLMAGIGEELLLVAFLVVALERMGANGPTIYVVAVVVRLAFHLYYGPASISLVLWAVVAVWIFRRTRLVMPLIVVHTLWDVNALSSEFVPVLSGLVGLAGLGCVVVTGIVHLVTRRRPDPGPVPVGPGAPAAAHRSALEPAIPLPGWYADPTDPTGLRWWDGRVWTPQVWR